MKSTARRNRGPRMWVADRVRKSGPARPAHEIRWGASGVALTAAGVLVLSGCGGADTTDGGQTSGSNPTTSSSYYSPVGEYLSPTTSSSPADHTVKEKQLQELVGKCMTGQGFDYVPFVYPAPTEEAPTSTTSYGSREWVEKYGYGISTMDAGGGFGTTSSSVTDPNQAIVDAMSAGERDAYYMALYGGGGGGIIAEGGGVAMSSSAVSADPAATDAASTDPAATDAASTDPAVATGELPADEPSAQGTDGASAGGGAVPVDGAPVGSDGAPSMPPLEEQGCWGQAQAEVYGDQMNGNGGQGNMDQFQDMLNAYNQLYDTIAKDDRVKAALTEWVGCMSGAGYPDLKDVWDANMQANDKWSELNGWPTSKDSMTGGVMTASSSAAPGTPTAPPADKVAEFRTYELKIALSDYDCKQSSKYDSVSDTVRIALEKDFVEQHKTELEQYRDAINGGG